ADAEAYKKRADDFTARKKAAENKAESLEKYLSRQLDGKGWKDVDFSVSFRTSKATDILDESLIPVDYLKPQPAKIDRDAILRTLKMGVAVPGARLIERQSMTVK
ncbi:MAG: siphovirus Gp157 family protein, partial [Clostridia bacterium]|nr:siphovirus Gp157 family protein [Clostridia bacterium]